MSLYRDMIYDAYRSMTPEAQKKMDEYAPRLLRAYIRYCFIYAAVGIAILAFLLL